MSFVAVRGGFFSEFDERIANVILNQTPVCLLNYHKVKFILIYRRYFVHRLSVLIVFMYGKKNQIFQNKKQSILQNNFFIIIPIFLVQQSYIEELYSLILRLSVKGHKYI